MGVEFCQEIGMAGHGEKVRRSCWTALNDSGSPGHCGFGAAR
jgi:hypothetical protein